jgi:hypothetical protein
MYLAGRRTLLIGVTLMIVTTSQEVAAQKQPPFDPYAQAYQAQRVERYKQSRQRFLTIIKNLYFSFGCKVFSDETSFTPLILNEYKQLLRGNEDLFNDAMDSAMKESARVGLARSKEAGECEYFTQNPDVVLEFRSAAHRALGF